MNDAVRGDVRALLTEIVESEPVLGIAVTVADSSGEVSTETVGQRDVEAGEPVTPRTQFCVGSCTKSSPRSPSPNWSMTAG